jgi:hypothetical protein
MYGTSITGCYFATEFIQGTERKALHLELSLSIYENSHWLYLRIAVAGDETVLLLITDLIKQVSFQLWLTYMVNWWL